MSFNLDLNQAVNQVVLEYINKVSVKFGVNKNELKALWDGCENTNTIVDVIPETVVEIQECEPYEDIQEIMKANVAVLRGMCKTHNIHVTSKTKKADMISLLSGKVPISLSSEPKPSKKTKNITKSNVNKKVLEKLKSNVPTVKLERMDNGNLFHVDTGFVFDPETQNVIYKQNDDGERRPLSPEDIETCHKYKFSYDIPENLDYGKNNLEDVKIEEVDNDDESVQLEQEIVDTDIEEESIDESLDEEDLDEEIYYDE